MVRKVAEKKLPRHRRMYADSPKLERGEDGNMAAKKPSDKRGEKASEGEKKADAAQAGIDGMKVNDGEPDMEPAEDARIQEIKDMHSRHQKEMGAIHKRHQKEDVKKYAKEHHDTDNNEAAGAGDREIKEIQDSKKITE